LRILVKPLSIALLLTRGASFNALVNKLAYIIVADSVSLISSISLM